MDTKNSLAYENPYFYWSESDNRIKQNIGCTIMALVFILGFLFSVLGTMKSCSSDNGPSYDYYDAPRK